MNKIAVAIITNGKNNYIQARICIENLLKNTDIPIHVYICDIISPTIHSESVVFYKTIPNLTYFPFFESYSTNNLAALKNKLLNYTQEEFICFVPIDVLVYKNWLQDLYLHYKNAENAGIIGIRNNLANCKLGNILYDIDVNHELGLYPAWIEENNFIDGILFMSKETIRKIGPFDEKSKAIGFENAELSFRATTYGLNNFYIIKQSVFNLPIKNERLFPKKTKDNFLVLKEMIDTKINDNLKTNN